MILIKNATIVDSYKFVKVNILIKGSYIYKIYDDLEYDFNFAGCRIIDASDKIVIPGVIDCHVHFREPGLSHKADIYTESKAGIAGGVTSYIEMPNTIPATVNIKELENKFKIAKQKSLSNYSFYIGVCAENIENIINSNDNRIAGIKLFLGTTTSGAGVTDDYVMKKVFSQKKYPVIVHCEDDDIINNNELNYKKKYGENIPIKYHRFIRSEEACFKSSEFAINLAKRHGTKLHIAHLSTAKELELVASDLPLNKKKITSEACVHHLWFSDEDYDKLRTKIKCNPSIKTKNDIKKLLECLNDNTIDIIATDHAPHTIEEKNNNYFNAPSGIPLIQFALPMMLELCNSDKITIQKIVKKMCNAPADIFNIKKRGYIKENYYADILIIDMNKKNKVTKDKLLYKCKWSPMENFEFNSKITHTFVNGNLVYENGNFYEKIKGKNLEFER